MIKKLKVIIKKMKHYMFCPVKALLPCATDYFPAIAATKLISEDTC
jgi:hypothetical protein